MLYQERIEGITPGVYWSSAERAWEAYVDINRKRHIVGHFDSKIRATYARDLFILEHELPHGLCNEFLRPSI